MVWRCMKWLKSRKTQAELAYLVLELLKQNGFNRLLQEKMGRLMRAEARGTGWKLGTEVGSTPSSQTTMAFAAPGRPCTALPQSLTFG